jgi:hypothetical protein
MVDMSTLLARVRDLTARLVYIYPIIPTTRKYERKKLICCSIDKACLAASQRHAQMQMREGANRTTSEFTAGVD